MAEENTETQVSDNDIKAMQAALKKANGEAAHYRNERNNLRDMVVSLKAERTLSEAGITNPKATKVLDFSKVTVTESGELEGLTEQLESLKEDFPELFGAGDKKVSGGADAANKTEAHPQKSSAEKLVARLKNS
ncbi:phage scaffolding protein [Streptomyces sp. NPDC003273]|uniref:phage scaffolding protein n=1 Tax=Streptomyces sp. NPDC003273 TaxID=3364678 RepID=UPI0036A26F42